MFVHFPVSLLLLYSLLEIIRFKKIHGEPYWFYVKAVVLFAGALGSIATYLTGETAAGLYDGPVPQAIESHSNFGLATVIFFCIMAVLYLVGWLRRKNYTPFQRWQFGQKIWEALVPFEKLLTESNFGIIVALIGGTLISITGALGGLIAYGPENDTVSRIIFETFFK